MYTLPKDFDIKQFIGAHVQQVCFAINVIHINFDDTRYIGIESRFILKDREQESEEITVFAVPSDSGLLKLLEQKVTDISYDERDNSLTIVFENGISVILLANEQYESYSLQTFDQHIII